MKFNTIEELLNYTEAIKGKTFNSQLDLGEKKRKGHLKLP